MYLLTLLQAVPDFRHLRGLRHELWFVLLLMISGAMCGYWGSRPLETFAQEYGAELCRQLAVPVPKRMPSYSTFRRILVTLDFTVFANVFNQWAQQTFGRQAGEWLAVDGKSIKGSLRDYDTAQQNFVMLVSLFSHQRGLVLHSQPMENKHTSEQHLVQQLLATLELKDTVVTADALHCHKNSHAVASATGALSAVR
ncbi:MAG: ISAs1 family transposase [Leptolyngbya sp. SIOISBB]|nr:ISAs1 family transposase [Leptolyngbya sp. SIOISBB]NEQ47173.1 ISAs1 family transposase [Leptolyngbya sp. SIOISBB]